MHFAAIAPFEAATLGAGGTTGSRSRRHASPGIAVTRCPVVVSITTLPSRIGRIRPCLESLLSGSMVPDKILLPLPHYSERERSDYVFPDFLGPAGLGEGTIEVVRVDRDWGPGTKLLGALSAIREPCCLIVADDDVRYKPRFLEGIVNAQMRDQSSSFSYYTYIAEGLTVGQGCDGFSFWTPNIGDAAAFAEKHVLGTPLFFHDDFWISFYLASKGIPVKSLSHLLDDGPIYETEYVERTALRYLEGPLERGRLHREGFERLLREVEMPAHRRLKIRARAALHRFLAEPSRKIIRKLVNAF